MPYTSVHMRSLKPWQQVALLIFAAAFFMFSTTAMQRGEWIYWVYPAVALVGIGITLWDGPGRKTRREEEAARRAREEELARKRDRRRR